MGNVNAEIKLSSRADVDLLTPHGERELVGGQGCIRIDSSPNPSWGT